MGPGSNATSKDVSHTQGATPTVVFIAQLATGGKSWQAVIERLNSKSATVTYDRPGIEQSPPRPAPNPPVAYSVLADELASLLDDLRISDPCVVVGHSIGSHIARIFAARFPSRVAGAVFVDGSIPQLHLYPDTTPVVDGSGPNSTEVDFIAGQVEILSVAMKPSGLHGDVPVRKPIPAVVITRKKNWRWADAPPNPAIDDLWAISQHILAHEWQAPLIIADEAGHQIPTEAPGLVAYSIDAVVQAVHSRKSIELDHIKIKELDGRIEG